MGQDETPGSMGRPTAPRPLDFGPGAFRRKPWGELLRALLVLRVCALPHILPHIPALLRGSRRVLGPALWGRVLGATFYGQFVGGRTHGEVAAAVGRLRAQGLRAMVAVASEEDVGQERRGEQWYDRNRGAMLDAVGLAAAVGQEPMMQLKVTAVLSARVCQTLSTHWKRAGEPLPLERFAAIMGGEEATFPGLTEAENRHLGVALRRLEDVVGRAVGQGVRVLVDAELSAVGPVLSAAALALMLRHNRDSPWVWNTYQAYLRDAEQRLGRDAEAVGRRGARFGVKLVRGAYLEEERRRCPTATHPTAEETHRSFSRCLSLALSVAVGGAGGGAGRLMVATHNESSLLEATERLSALGLPPRGPVCFGQLLGMGDHLSLPLAQAGYVVYKSVPVGAAEEVLPYLWRRAQENAAVLQGSRRERELLRQELFRRLLRRP